VAVSAKAIDRVLTFGSDRGLLDQSAKSRDVIEIERAHGTIRGDSATSSCASIRDVERHGVAAGAL